MKKIIFVFTIIFLCKNVNSQNGFCFNPFQQNMVGSYAQYMGVADFNSDGKLDVFYEAYHGFELLLSNGTGSYSATSYTITQDLHHFKSADFNNDGHADIAAINSTLNSVYVKLGNGNGGFGATGVFQVDSFPADLIVADFNNDGKPDLSTANYIDNTISILFGTGTGSFQPAVNYFVGGDPLRLVADDFNNDGNMDIYVISNPGRILCGNGLGTFTLAAAAALNAKTILAVDINADSKIDLIYSDMFAGKIFVLHGNGNLTFTTAQTISLSPAFNNGTIASADFNNDGKMDLMATVDNSVAIYPGSSSGVFSGPLYFQASQYTMNNLFTIIAADLNGDGKIDVLGSQDNAPGIINLLLNCNTVDVGIEEKNIKNFSVNLFPNPASDFLSLEFPSESNFKTISIYNNLGQLLLEQEISTGDKKISITTSHLAEGVYFIKLKSITNGTISKRFVISH